MVKRLDVSPANAAVNYVLPSWSNEDTSRFERAADEMGFSGINHDAALRSY